ncbi:extracellular solute-binding protein [Desulfospira joergensenii]|uniref:extracellular solute-binding protein n=1 Tax=Desulfospira joergensenii TaxID=53329 RepID=UPI0004075CBA|nr:extracellular solute-binding protein [Desulfospira joergensenii]
MKSANQVVFILVVFICFLGLIHSSFANETLRLHVWDGYAPEGKVGKFENYIQQKYNRVVKLEISYISDPNDFFEQIRGKKADIISPGHNLLKDARFNFIKNKILLPLDLNNIPNYKNLISNLQNAEYSYQDGKVYAVPFAHGPYGLAYNTAHLNAPDSWGVFWDSKYKDKYTISLDY